jgi:hypothetical protein
MSRIQYMLAKHVPDLFRKEPRNIGVIVWSERGIEARFWGVDSFGGFDKRKIPDFVDSKNAYEKWVAFWLAEIKKPVIEFIGLRKVAASSSPEFVQAIQTGNADNFFLQEAGAILEPIAKDGLPGLADELFELLVTAEAVDEPDTTKLIHEACEGIIEKTKLSNNKHFSRKRFLYPHIIPNVMETIEFSYFYGNGAPQWLGQEVPLKRYKSQLRREIDSVCWRFDRAIKAQFIKPEQGAAFVFPTAEQAEDKDVIEAIKILGSITNVFDLRQPEKARQEFEKVAAIPISSAIHS